MSVFARSFNKRISDGGELPQEVLVAVWGAKKAKCQRATNSDTETKHQSQCVSSDWTKSENSERERGAANPAQGHKESLVKTEGKRKEGRH